MSKALPRFMYGDPMQTAMRMEAQSCKGCVSLERVFGVDVCGKGRKQARRCWQFEQIKGVECSSAIL